MGNGSISEAHTGVIPQSRPPNGKPPEPSKRLPRVKAVFNSMGASSEQWDVFRIVPGNLVIAVGQTGPLEGYIVRFAHLLDVPLHDDIAELFVQFDGAADAVGLLTGDEGAAGTAERVQHDGVAHGGIENGIGQERD